MPIHTHYMEFINGYFQLKNVLNFKSVTKIVSVFNAEVYQNSGPAGICNLVAARTFVIPAGIYQILNFFK